MWSSSTGPAPFLFFWGFFLPPSFPVWRNLPLTAQNVKSGFTWRPAGRWRGVSVRVPEVSKRRGGGFRRLALKRLEGTEQKSGRLSPRRASVRKREEENNFFFLLFPYTPWFAALSLERTEGWDLIFLWLIRPVKIKIPPVFQAGNDVGACWDFFCQRDKKTKKKKRDDDPKTLAARGDLFGLRRILRRDRGSGDGNSRRKIFI